jgi:predicted alpha/beta superfamily hydrolase
MSHRGVRRISDYTPYKNAEYPTGYGKRIAEIIAENIGSSERALGIKDVKLENRVIGGSSLGGIMSAYAVANNPTIFGKAVVFSPAFYINPELLEYLARSNSANSKSKIAIWAGGSESETMVPLIEKYGAILDKNKINHNLIIDPNGQHNEANWAVAFPSAIKFLFGK